MNIEKKQNGKELVLLLSGRLDTTTAPQLEEEIKKDIEGIENLTLDFKQLEYISSAGLRVLLLTQKMMQRQGKLVIIHVNDTIQDVFDMTGFCNILTII